MISIKMYTLLDSYELDCKNQKNEHLFYKI
jgi:hypothetical protein